jgi:hypothetical protein
MKLIKFSAALFSGLFLMLAAASQVAVAQSSVAQSSAAPAAQGGTVPRPSSLLTYAWVVTNNVQVYAKPGDATPVRDLGAGFLYVSLPDARPIVVGDQTWYQINRVRQCRRHSYHPALGLSRAHLHGYAGQALWLDGLRGEAIG